MSTQITKALSNEEMTIVSNIESLLSELKNINTAEDNVENPGMIEMAEDNTEIKPEEPKMEKGLETTPSDSATASDNAETRIDEANTELTEESVNEVAKMLMKLAQTKKPVKKSANEQLLEVIKEVVSVQKSSQGQINELQTAFSNMLDGLGVTKQLQVAEKTIKTAPKVDNDNEAIMSYIRQQINKDINNGKSDFDSNSMRVRKNLQDKEIISGFFGPRTLKKYQDKLN